MLAIDASRDTADIPNIPRITLKWQGLPKGQASTLDYWNRAIQTGRKALNSFSTLKASGFTPDLILMSTWTGTSLGICEAFPDSFRVNYLEPMRFASPAEIVMRRSLQAMQMAQSGMSFAFKATDLASIGRSLRKTCALAPICVDAEYFTPNNGCAGSAAAIFLKENRQLPQWLRLAQELAQMEEISEIALIVPSKHMAAQDFGNEKIKAFSALGRGLAKRLYANGSLFIAPDGEIGPEMLEAMSCGACVLANDEGLAQNHDYLPMPKNGLAPFIQSLMLNEPLRLETGAKARVTAMADYSMQKLMPPHFEAILNAMRAAGKDAAKA